MSQYLCHFLLLVYLTGGAVVLVTASDHSMNCGYDISCHATLKLMTSVSEMKKQLDELSSKQATGLEELKMNLSRSLAASTAVISTQLEKHAADSLRHDERLKSHDVSQTDLHKNIRRPQDCTDVRARGHSVSGVYQVFPGNNTRSIEMDVYCDFRIPGQSWLVFQRRKDGSVSFERTWIEYANGFGNLNGEFWLGNDKLSFLTMNKRYMLRVELEDFSGQKRYAMYSTFTVRPSTDKYQLIVGGYSGDAGDGLAYHNGYGFTTKDVDNDDNPGNCARLYRGAWWYAHGHYSNINGFYYGGSHNSFADGVGWLYFRGHHYSLKATAMKIMTVY